VKIRSI
jgi:hypothetical protein